VEPLKLGLGQLKQNMCQVQILQIYKPYNTFWQVATAEAQSTPISLRTEENKGYQKILVVS